MAESIIMPQFITQKMLDQAFAKFRQELKVDFATKQDLASMENRLEAKIDQRAEIVEEKITEKFSKLQSSVDHYLLRTETWHEEQDVLQHQHDRLEKSLIRKNVISEDDLLS